MTILPEPLKRYSKEGKALISKGAVGEMEFSGGTYQVQVADPKSGEAPWAFLQFDGKGHLTDCFCSCGEDRCVHVAAAYYKIFGSSDEPLHFRFEKSLWNRLCYVYAEDYGSDPEVLSHKKDTYAIVDFEGKEVFSAKEVSSEGAMRLRQIFHERIEETEETSLKFSNLSPEEIRLWRQGRPSSQLRYELSYWNDLAKWMMVQQEEGKKFAIAFSYNSLKIPDRIFIRFPDVHLEFSLSRPYLLAIIPSLSTVEAPLRVYGNPEDLIEKIEYDPEKGELSLLQKPFSPEDSGLEERNSLILGNWIFYPGRGFFPREKHPLLGAKTLRGKEIGALLSQHLPLVRSKLIKTKVREVPEEIRYDIAFDSDWNLRIEGYVFERKDLLKKESKLFGDWVYLDQEGFVPIERVVYNQIVTVVPENEVGDFVRQYRAWFNEREGYRTHVTGIETKLTYALTDHKELVFQRVAVFEGGTTKSKDFGPWVYIEGQGFFAKLSPEGMIPIRGGEVIPEEEIPHFIRRYREELHLIEGFFSKHSPVAKMGLVVELGPDEAVDITPKYELSPRYGKDGVTFFDEYTYVDGEGFCRVPLEVSLPERFLHGLHLKKENLSSFFKYEFDQLKKFALQIDPRLSPPTHFELVADTLSEARLGYALKLRYASGRASVRLSDIWEAMRKKERYLFSDVGLIDLSLERFKWIEYIGNEQMDSDANVVVLSPLELLRLYAFDAFKVTDGEDLLKDLTEFRVPEEPDVSHLRSHLRPYQEIGLKWLWFLYHHHLSGLLCDDMGLGKTHQAMALMAAVASTLKKKGHFLVICPTSVLYHWEEKLHDFLPDARVCTFHGSKRSLDDFHEEYDILLTSYGIWRNEIELLSEVTFEVAIFDEIQAAKNQASRLHASLLKVRARVKVGLTGTPIENRLRELKALFDLILPNYMLKEADYRQFFAIPIERENNQSRKQLLSKFIHPFVLRRKKEEVLSDLPEKIEEVSHCELSLDQKLLYNEVLRKVREGIYRQLGDSETPIPYIHVFSALSSLKQICNHPAAYLKIPNNFTDYQSGKWDLFVELLGEALESGQKVVVFSQYLAMLDIVEGYLSNSGIGYASIRGATVNRGDQVRKFNTDPLCEVFVGSLQAAGLGIDLTAGSVVIHYDRWWNAAREDQATDRVHRIGQKRGVQVFKLVTKGTFEERIDEMILKKGKLMEDVVGIDDYRVLKQFNREEIMQLFRDI